MGKARGKKKGSFLTGKSEGGGAKIPLFLLLKRNADDGLLPSSQAQLHIACHRVKKRGDQAGSGEKAKKKGRGEKTSSRLF